ncbi:type 1 glutamine amidotransferase [Psychromarinibacter sp. C21-152]|uniref:Type 1 glutamine amidotransferase n=1 Tax=Psychromarinibacter sediminicola TaxID=3033385 RepID=A0AAE3NP84_9RHOB|nr:type 1 glutamine amidotransferase [Psychromarinibacter sediminicola]MDF0599944.1 type 1 glutamine amidotransferase [Psychromarinibacter sediminicola]
MKIGILQTGHLPDTLLDSYPEYPAMFERLLDGHGFSFDTYPVVDMVLPGSIHAADGWLITGSRHGAYEDHAWIAPLEQFIRDAYGADVPVVGICFGHQIMAQALGGRVEKYDGGWTVGRQPYDFGALGTVHANAWHQDQVVAKPADAEVVATGPHSPFAGLVYDRHAFSLQPHPEFDADFLGALIDFRGQGVVPPERLQQARDGLDRPVDKARLAEMIARFFKERRYA